MIIFFDICFMILEVNLLDIYIKFPKFLMFVWCSSVCHVFVTMVTHPYISAKNIDNDTKLSGYDPWCLPSTSITPKPNPTSSTLICHDLSWPSHPIFFTMVTHPYISAKNQDNDTKLSGYDPLGLPSTSITCKPNPTSPTLIRHDLSWPSHPIKSNLHISAKSWWISTKFSA